MSPVGNSMDYDAPIYLDENDPFDKVLIPLVKMNRKKRADYAQDGDPFSNFRETAEELTALGVVGFTPKHAAQFNILQKTARLKALIANGRSPENESVIDTEVDKTIYQIIYLALVMEEYEQVQTAVVKVNG